MDRRFLALGPRREGNLLNGVVVSYGKVAIHALTDHSVRDDRKTVMHLVVITPE